VPSRRNSGFDATPKSSTGFRGDRFDDADNPFNRSGQDSAADRDAVVAGLPLQHRADLLGEAHHLINAQASVGLAGSSDTQEADIGLHHGLRDVCCRRKPALVQRPVEQFVHAVRPAC
jgi:hypothetical protein